MWPYSARMGPARAPNGLFTGCLSSLNPYGARKLIMHALKLNGPRTGGQNSYGAARDPHGSLEWTYDFCSKQPGNNPGTTRTGPGSVMWLGHYWCMAVRRHTDDYIPRQQHSWGQHGAHLGTQVGPMLATWTLLSGWCFLLSFIVINDFEYRFAAPMFLKLVDMILRDIRELLLFSMSL